MSIKVFIALMLFLAGVWLIVTAPSSAEPAPVRAGQPHPDVFEVAGFGSLAPLNPVTVRAKAERMASYRLILMPSCVAGQIVSDMQALSNELQRAVGFGLVRDDTNPNFTVRLNCGTDQSRICGSVNVFCLGRNFPYTPDADISDIMYAPIQWPLITRLSILCHEICGHALGTWDEQYCKGLSYPPGHPCYRLTLFTSTPNWRDFMNTGELSRHLFEDIETERWERTMYALQAPPYQDCTTYPDWEGTTSCFWPEYGAWLWLIIDAQGREQLWEWSPTNPRWRCTRGCPT